MFSRFARVVSAWAGGRSAFALALLLIIGWAAAGPYFHWSDSHSLFVNTTTTIITFLMVFLIQNTQNRDSAALHAKIDELIRVTTDADDRLIKAEIAGTEDDIAALRGA